MKQNIVKEFVKLNKDKGQSIKIKFVDDSANVL